MDKVDRKEKSNTNKTVSPNHKEFLQAGGRNDAHLLIPSGDCLLKATFASREHSFYKRLHNYNEWVSSKITPEFYGFENHDLGHGMQEYIRMKNVTFNYKRPFVLDLKVGIHSWHPEIPSYKLQKRLKTDETSTTNLLGVRFCGCKRVVGDQTLSYNRHLSLNEITTRDALKRYIKLFLFDGVKYRVAALPYFVSRLDKIIELMRMDKFRIFGASTLFVYDADAKDEEKKFDLRFIDFAHTWCLDKEECKMEDGVIFGMENLKCMLNEISVEITGKKIKTM
ncbi:hypothetical protein EIN_247460 [Entamoeba invadens IP1]|uniref:Kinase n=1 Tax=Entamoeba invadens IP1 TaxID=370355 RepID=A0A0A1UH75_ENTIV|nr:hypothetical protein EIN_247460 [Entamoeba invadens IP1]ELP94832.1 hypothetical protein EIN_247460 [Entamoeba invadens IP1]|eukprot:XP_004261603.1 hypothetical protein EIN_247460 [Entamoeba invadens IP1]